MSGRDGAYVFKDFPHSSHRVLLGLVGRTPVRVLDVGAGSGYLGAALSAVGHTVAGVELDPEAAAAARVHYAAFHVLDAQRLPALPEAPFDVILAGDLLEHLADPGAALGSWLPLLAPGGRLLASVPNVAFVQVRLALLAGRFEYRPRGVLDRTHLRFFTRGSFCRLLEGSGLRVTRLLAVPPPLPLLLPAAARWPLRALVELAATSARVWPSLLAYQIVAEARR